MSANPKNEPNGNNSQKITEAKWSKALAQVGYTTFPSIIIERQHQLGLTPLDMNILVHIAMRWWTADSKPHPSKGSMAQALGVHPRTIQRRIAALEKAGMIQREERREGKDGSQPNLYHLDGLIALATPFAEEKIEEIETRKAVAKAKAARKGPPKLKIVPSD